MASLDELKRREYIVFGAEHINPLGEVRSLGEAGLNPIVVIHGSGPRVTSASKYPKERHFVSSLEEGYRLIMERWANGEDEKPFVILSDDATVAYFDARYDEWKDRLFTNNAGVEGRLCGFLAKRALNELAARHGFRVPATHVSEKGEIPEGLSYPVITKSDDSLRDGWKGDSHVCKNREELEKVLSGITHFPILIQECIDKEDELTLEGFSYDRGKKVFVSVRTGFLYRIEGTYGFHLCIRDAKGDDLEQAVAAMLGEIGYEGPFEAEFLVDRDGGIYFLEINFRNSAWGYATASTGMSNILGWIQGTLDPEGFVPVRVPIKEGYTAISELSDFKQRVLKGHMNPLCWNRICKNADCHFLWNKEDPKPLRSAFWGKVFRRH